MRLNFEYDYEYKCLFMCRYISMIVAVESVLCQQFDLQGEKDNIALLYNFVNVFTVILLEKCKILEI